jgi:hypothetical protein
MAPAGIPETITGIAREWQAVIDNRQHFQSALPHEDIRAGR